MHPLHLEPSQSAINPTVVMLNGDNMVSLIHKGGTSVSAIEEAIKLIKVCVQQTSALNQHQDDLRSLLSAYRVVRQENAVLTSPN